MKIFRIKRVMHYITNIEVWVYSSASTMNRGIKRLGYVNVPYCQASVNPSVFIKDNKRSYLIRVFLNAEDLGMNIITHESVHIGTTILRNAHKSVRLSSQVDDNEERLAYVIGKVGSLIVANLLDLGYYKE